MSDAVSILVIYVVSLFGYSILPQNFFNNRLFLVLFLGFTLLLWQLFKKGVRVSSNIDFGFFLKIVFLVNSLLFILFSRLSFNYGFLAKTTELLSVLVFFGAVLFLFDWPKRKHQIYSLTFFMLLALVIVSRGLVILDSPSPRIDTYELFKSGPKFLIAGQNPYAQFYKPLYLGVEPNYYSYSPLTLFIFMPAVLFFNEPRITYIFVDLIVVFLLYKMLIKRKNKQSFSANKNALAPFVIPLLFLYHPSRLFIFDQSWMDPLIFMALVIFVYLEKFTPKMRKFSFLFLGLFLGLRHTMLITTPLFFLFRKISLRVLIAAVGFVGLVFLPFILWSFSDFWQDLVLFYINYPQRFDSLTLNSFLWHNWELTVPKTLMNTSGLIFLFLAALARPKSWTNFLISVAFFLWGFAIFSKLAFINHYFLISSILLLAAVLGVVEDKTV